MARGARDGGSTARCCAWRQRARGAKSLIEATNEAGASLREAQLSVVCAMGRAAGSKQVVSSLAESSRLPLPRVSPGRSDRDAESRHESVCDRFVRRDSATLTARGAIRCSPRPARHHARADLVKKVDTRALKRHFPRGVSTYITCQFFAENPPYAVISYFLEASRRVDGATTGRRTQVEVPGAGQTDRQF